MFTGIIEKLGIVKAIEKDRTNVHFIIESDLSAELKIDQSVSHNGACLTVVEVGTNWHRVTAVEETLERTNLGDWNVDSLVNLERCLALGGRLDGHMVQGHVDALATCQSVEDLNGSWRIHFQYLPTQTHILVDKGSVCLNGVSLTVVNPVEDQFSVAIIPYTWEHTNFHLLKPGYQANIEFDIIGKYVAKYLSLR
jgi:riboflavin synthase